MALAKVINAEFKDLVARGVDWIQIHEPLTYYGKEAWFIEVLNTAFEGVDAHRIWRICYGNQGGNPGVGEPRGQDMFPFAFAADVDQIHIETMRRGSGDLRHLKDLPAHMSLGLGVIDVKSMVIEDPRAVADRLVEAAQYVPAERIAVSTDCGLLNLKSEHAARKLEALVAGTRIARDTLAGS